MKYILGLLILLSSTVLFAQTPGTFPPQPTEIEYIKANIIAKETELADTLMRIPIQSYIFRSTTNAGLSLTDLNRGLAIVNGHFFGTGIQFYLLEPVDITNPNLFDFNRFSEEPTALSLGRSQEAINLYCFNTVQDFSANEVWGYTYFPSETQRNEIFVSNNAVKNGRELTRLLGHYFGLFNTAETATGTENTNGSNCTEAGDLICDTPADLNTGIVADTVNCTHNGSTVTAIDGGNYANAPISNLMSLYPSACATDFTAQQKMRLLAGALHKKLQVPYTTNATNVFVPAALQGNNFGNFTTLVWADIADNELGYWIERATQAEGGFQVIGGLPPNSSSFLDTAVVAGQTYYYRITAANSGFRYSETISVAPKTAYCTPLYTEACAVSTVSQFNFQSLGASVAFPSCLSEQFKVVNFSDFTLNAGSNYPFIVELAGEAQRLTLWADLDGNGTFEPTEKLLEEPNGNLATYSNNLLIPSEAKTGIMRFRLRTRRATEGNIDSPCAAYGAGTTLDFWLKVQGNESPCVAFDRAILNELFLQLGGNNWSNATNWGTALPLRNWQGVSVNAQGCVSALSLPNNNLQGELAEILFQLSSLNFLDLSENKITGSLPAQISKLKNLVSLSFNNNMLEGTLPKEVASLSNLTFVELHNNQLTGEVPEGLKNLPLTGLNLKNNQLSRLPDLSSVPNWNVGSIGLEVENNLLSFDDLLPHISIRDFRFIPQKPFLSLDTIRINHGTNYTIQLGIDSAIADNVYRWRLNNQFLLDTNRNTLLVDSTNLPGVYRYEVEVSNPAVSNFSLRANPIVVNILPTDSTALAAFYHSTNGPAWRIKWDLQTPIATWFGLSFNAEGRVRRISLVDNNLRGSIPEEFKYLTELTDLRLANNRLEGDFKVLENSKKLRILWLYQNQFSGQLPKELGELTELEELLLYGNQFSGEIPQAFSNLTKLKNLSLNDNLLTGEVPTSFQKLTALQALRLENNRLTGIPDLSNITSWEFFAFAGLQIQNNQLTFEDVAPNAPIFNYTYAPQQKIGEEKQVTVPFGNTYTINLNIDDTLTTNQYKWYRDGELLITTDTNRLTVNEIGIYRCEVTNAAAPLLTLESLPVAVLVPSVDSVHLAGLYQRTDGANWTRPWDLSTPVTTWEGVTFNRQGRVVKLNLSTNNLSGILPFDVGRMSELEELDVSGNKLSGMSIFIAELQKLKVLNLSYNNFTSFPEPIYQLLALETLYLHNNEIAGTISSEVSNLRQLSTLQLAQNNLDNLPLFNLPNLGAGEQGILNLEGNRLTFSDIKPNLSVPNFVYNPQQEVGKEETVVLDESQRYTIAIGMDNPLPNNRYTWLRNGVSFENAPNAQQLEVTSAGTYQAEITNDSVPNLTLFSRFTTVQNPTIDSLALVALYQSTGGANWQTPWDVSQPMNTWGGVTLDASRSVSQLNLANRGISGQLPEELNKLQSVLKIDLSNNNLEGNIPNAFGELETLVSLNLSVNRFTGEAPSNLSNLRNLEALLLQNNQLTGLPTLNPSNPWNNGTEGGFQVQNNQLTFEDLLKNQSIPNFKYSPQAEIGIEKSEIIYFDNKPVIDLNIDSQVLSNQYQWFKDALPLEVTSQARYVLAEPGIYFAEVTNPSLPNLTLKSKATTAEKLGPTDRLRVDSESYRTIYVTWNDNDTLETGYSIERALASDLIFTPVATTEKNTENFDDRGLLDNTRYAYRIQTVREGGKSFYSDTVRVTTPSIDFDAEQTEIQVGKTTKFRAFSNISPAAIEWNFGQDAFPQTSTDFRPTVRYSNGEGAFDVSLTAVSTKGDTATIVKENYIQANCPNVNPVILVDRFILISTFAQQYQWFYEGEKLEEETSQQLAALEAGEYQVEIVDSLGCRGISEPVQITVTSLNNNPLNSVISVYPNPSKGKFNVALPSQLNHKPTILVYTVGGEQQNLSSSFTKKRELWETIIDLSSKPRGMYLLHIMLNNEQVVKKILLE